MSRTRSARASQCIDAFLQGCGGLGEIVADDKCPDLLSDRSGIKCQGSNEGRKRFRRARRLDVMPTDRAVLGFGNRWYDEAVRTAVIHTLPGGTSIRLITAPVFIATKFEAFADRGDGDFLASHDLVPLILEHMQRISGLA